MCRQRGWRKVIAVIYEKNVAALRSAAKYGYKKIHLSADSGEKGVYILELSEAPRPPEGGVGSGYC